MKYNIQVKRNKWTQIDIYIYIHIRDTLYKWYKSLLTVFAFAFLDECLILDILMAGLAVKPRAVKKNGRIIWLRLSIRHFGNFTHRLTSSALCAIKNPCVFACILAPRGLMDILLSAPSSAPLISMANNSNFSLEKHSLNATNSEMWERRRQKGNIWITPVLYGAF